jgi:predicted HicB family RNase H-like nuclease
MREQVLQKPIKRLTLRIPAALVAQAQRQAGATRCSLNRYIVELLS